jgi:(p)ppGpp synthase/HD superfamily hydrolase
MLFSPLLERAVRFASAAHRHQMRKGSAVPYISHPVQVAWILVRAGFTDETWLTAAVLHDVVEDCGVTLEELRREFSPEVAEIVAGLSEQKCDEHGRRRPWEDRKREHLAVLAAAPRAVRAVALADKLHNLETMALDLAAGEPVWERFTAPRERLLAYYREAIDRCGGDDPALAGLTAACRAVLARIAPQEASASG